MSNICNTLQSKHFVNQRRNAQQMMPSGHNAVRILLQGNTRGDLSLRSAGRGWGRVVHWVRRGHYCPGLADHSLPVHGPRMLMIRWQLVREVFRT